MLTPGTLIGLSFIQRYRFLTIPQFASADRRDNLGFFDS